MMIKFLFLVLFGCFAFTASAQKSAYTLFHADGEQVPYTSMIDSLENADVLLFGELHNNPISHWLQLEVTKDLNEKTDLILGAEMFERDNHDSLALYLQDSITKKEFQAAVRLWGNYDTDYAPLVEFAKENDLPFIATNIPRRYASMVHKKDFAALDSLTAKEKEWIAPLPIAFDPELPTYKNILKMMGDHGSPLLVKAQASKDATMAHFILRHYENDHTFIHYNGAYHSDFYEGILWYLKRQNGNLRYATITTVSQADVYILAEEHKGKADFIICVDEDMTKTY